MGWLVIRVGGSLTDGTEVTFSRDVPTNADPAEHDQAYEDAHAFIDRCKIDRLRYGAPSDEVSAST